MYRTFLTDTGVINPNVRVIGLTATPFRMTTGSICAPENILNHVCYEVGVRELIVQGYLTRLITKAKRIGIDITRLRVRAGEFVASEVEEMMDEDLVVHLACNEIVELAADRKSCLIFAAGVKHGEHVAEVLKDRYSAAVATVFSETGNGERSRALADFRDGKFKYLVNVNVLTTGFDAPNIDCVVLLRPTMSPGLYYQMVGRGFRTFDGKENCLVLDFGENVLRHGPVDMLKVKSNRKGEGGDAPAKECPECQTVIAAGYSRCPECGYEFPPPQRSRHEAKASDAPILSTEVKLSILEVQETTYHRHVKHGADPSRQPTLRVDYRVGWQQFRREWICFEHDGFARERAVDWWKKRSMAPVPDTVDEALKLAHSGALAPTLSIRVQSQPKRYDRIFKYEIGEIPAWEEERECGPDVQDEKDPGQPEWMNSIEAPF